MDKKKETSFERVRKRRPVAGAEFAVCLIYPNRRAVGMSNLGFQKIYAAINAPNKIFCDIAFRPDEKADEKTSPASVERNMPLGDFDLLAFSITFEMDALNILEILNRASVPLRRAERENSDPIVCAGGVAIMLNPEPLSDFIDFFVIGEGEVFVHCWLESLAESQGETREARLEKISSMPGIYVPSLYGVEYDEKGILKKRTANNKGAPETIKRIYNRDYRETGTAQCIDQQDDSIFKETFLLETGKGCGQGCRFCAAGFVYRHVRHVKTSVLKKQISSGLKKYKRIGLVGSAVSEHPAINDIYDYILGLGGEVTVSSLRVEYLDKAMLRSLYECGCRSITIAPEAGTERLRRIINKNVTDKRIIETVSLAAGAGILNIKVYFLIGLPGETERDVTAIAELVKKMRDALVENSKPFGRAGRINVSVNPFVPKPHTPFQWECFGTMRELKKNFKILRRSLGGEQNVKLKTGSVKNFSVQALLSVGTRRVGGMLLDALRGKSWSDILRMPEAISVYARRKDKDEVLPWDFIDNTVTKKYLWKEYENSRVEKTTLPCPAPRTGCRRCGIFEGICT
ncbi:MAG: radical SAM protein [bacterium]|nr:MAG: radical SAM protein [bacterium]